MFKKTMILLLAFLAPVLLIFLMVQHAAQATTTYVGCKPVELTVKTGQTFYLTVAVTDTVDLYAWQFDADYNGTYLEFLHVFPGNALRSDGTSHYYIAPVHVITTTIAQRAAATRLQVHNGVDGNGEIAYVFFRAIQQNTSGTNVNLEAVELVDRNALEISKTLANSGNCKVVIRNDADELIQPPVGELIYLPLIYR